MIHMTSTIHDINGSWSVVCRCQWRADGLPDRSAARAAGDDHLSVANGVLDFGEVSA